MAEKSSSSLLSSSKFSSLLGKLQPSRPHLQSAISDFHIRLHRPHHKYAPGDLVTGSIVLSTVRSVRLTHVTLTLSGFIMLCPSGRSNCASNLASDVRKQKGNHARARGTPIFGGGGLKGVMLFEEEQVVIGEGRLSPGVVEVGFEMEFPSKGLVSGIEFERGSISYQLTATLTRPTTLNPVSQFTTELQFRDKVDVAYFHPPKPLTLSIEAVSTTTGSRKRLKSSASSSDKSNPTSPQLSPTLPNMAVRKSKGSSSSTASCSAVTHPTATIELQKAGVLPGDVIPLKISIYHTKPLKSMSGIIVTLSRHGRFDTYVIDNPSELNPDAEDKSVLTARSLTFSRSAIQAFRKDLDQNVTPLIVDPRTLTTVVRTSVRVPEDAFPSITGVPGGVVSFTYFIEVIVDLGGKLAQRTNAISGAMSGIMNGSGGDDVKRVVEVKTTDQGLDTHKLRREKGVISCTFDIVVGTLDSGRHRRRRTTATTNSTNNTSHNSYGNGSSNGSGGSFVREIDNVSSHRNSNNSYENADTEKERLRRTDMSSTTPDNDSNAGEGCSHGIPAPMYEPSDPPSTSYSHVPPPPTGYSQYSIPPPPSTNPNPNPNLYMSPPPPTISPSNSNTHSNAQSYAIPSINEPASEKARLLAAEARLLPSAPDTSSSSSSYAYEPSAPALFFEQVPSYEVHDRAPSPLYTSSSSSRTPGGTHGGSGGSSDKMELERRRLASEASAPPVASGSSNGGGGYGIASAPVIDEEGDRELPRYQR